MNDFIRLALYDAEHPVKQIKIKNQKDKEYFDVVDLLRDSRCYCKKYKIKKKYSKR